jgi:hypothetical protein
MYGNVMRVRWEKEMQQRQREGETVADGGEPQSDD